MIHLTEVAQSYTVAASWLADNGPRLAFGAGRIALIIAVAVALRLLAKRVIDRMTRGAEGGRSPAILRPLRERSPQALGPAVTARRAQRAKTVGSLLKSITSFVVYGVAFVLILGELGINLAPILASAGVLGVAVAFGAQNLVKDFLSGMFMMLEDQYGVGDVVDVGDASGTIEAVGLRVTTLRDVNGTVWYVRNGEVTRVGNSSQGYAVAVVDLPLAFNADLHRAMELVEQVAADAVTTEPLSTDVIGPPDVLGVEKVSQDGITLRMTVKVRAGRQWATQRALRAKIMVAFDKAGLEPPVRTSYVADPAAAHGTS